MVDSILLPQEKYREERDQQKKNYQALERAFSKD
jgi:hypothetical protein